MGSPGFHRIALCAALLLAAAAMVRAQEAGTITFTVDATRTKPISRFIYGWNHVESWGTAEQGITLDRLGGNRWTAYNWVNNVSNAGNDWHFESDDYLGGGNVPGGAVRGEVERALKAGAAIIVTVPIIGHVANKHVDNAMNDPNHLADAFVVSLARKGSVFAEHPTLADGKVYQDEFVNWLEKTFPTARRNINSTIIYDLDNEPDIWAETHKEVHPVKVTYEELTKLNIEYGLAIKAVAPEALTFGFVSYGWGGYTTLQGAPDANGRAFLDYYLAALATAEKSDGRRAVDVLDLHWYSEARGGGKRVIEDGGPETAKARIQATRSLWDPTYTEDSWITHDDIHRPIQLIPWLQEKIAKHYPGTKLAFDEYNFGGGNSISGAIAEADTLGIFGREGVFAAALWPLADKKQVDYQLAAINTFRNYDGQGGSFGDTALAVSPAGDPGKASLYASRDSHGNIVLVALNKTDAKLSLTIDLKGFTPRQGQAFYLTAAKPQSVRGADPAVNGTSLSVELPPLAVATLVLTPAALK